MELVVTCEGRFFQTPDGVVWTQSAFQNAFWDRYLRVFESVKVVARVKPVANCQTNWKVVNSERVKVVGLPYYVGLFGLLKNIIPTIQMLKQEITPDSAVIYRVPSQAAMLSTFVRNKRDNFYALEVVGDPSDVFKSGIVNSLMDRILGWISKVSLQKMARRAHAISYVTNSYLQRRYPPNEDAFTVACSSIELKDQYIRANPRIYQSPAKKLLFIGSLGQLYKGPDTLIRALAKLNKDSGNYQLVMLGDGVYRAEMESLADSLGCREAIQFVGEVQADKVIEYIHDAELLVMPSRTEGLPRALIEAMADGLAAVGSSVGGIPELLPNEHIFTAEDVDMLAQRIHALAESTEKLNQASTTNLQVAKQYQSSILNDRRKSFYQHVRDNTKINNENSAFN